MLCLEAIFQLPDSISIPYCDIENVTYVRNMYCYVCLQLDILCFIERFYIVNEGDGFVLVTLNFSRPLPYDSNVWFRYNDTASNGKLCMHIEMLLWNVSVIPKVQKQ